ncbi:MAG: hypothetical protein ABIA21_03745 [Candidatus Aenigmatarchaeota archaeon]
MKKIAMLCMVIFFLIAVISIKSYAEVEETIYVTFDGENTHIKQINTFYTTPDYYLISFTYEEIFSSIRKNLQIHDNDKNLLKVVLNHTEENYSFYDITIPEIHSYNSPYYVYYEFDYLDVLSNYRENFDAEFYLLNMDRNVTRKVYFCLPSDAGYPVYYDSRPSDTYSNIVSPIKYSSNPVVSAVPTITQVSSSTLFEPEPNFCQTGKKERVYPTTYDDYTDKIADRWSSSSSSTGLSEYRGRRLFISIPDRHEEDLNIMKDAENIVPYIDELNFGQPDNYSIYIVDEEDAVFDSTDDMIMCYDTGECYIGSSITLNSPTNQVANIVKAMIMAAHLKTYGENTRTNWWEDGSIDYLMLDAMKYAKIDTTEIEVVMSLTEDELNSVGNDITDQFQQYYVAIKAVKDLENLCPQHINKINGYIKTNNIIMNFNDEMKFNDFLVFAFSETCGKDVTPIFQKYHIKYDSIILNKYFETRNTIDADSGFNFFKTESIKHLQNYRNGFLIGNNPDDNELDMALDALDQGKTNSVIALVIVIIIIIGILTTIILKKKRKTSNKTEDSISSPEKHRYAH